MKPVELAVLLENLKKSCRDEKAWQEFREGNVWFLSDTNERENCGVFRRVFQHKQTGAFFSYGKLCEQWLCETCGPGVAEKLFRRLVGIAERRGGMWYAPVDVSASMKAITVLRQRVRKRSSDKKADYCIVHRRLWLQAGKKDVAYVFASAELTGRLAPKKMIWLRVDFAKRVLSIVIRVPGIWPYGVSASKGWQRGKDTEQSEYRFVTNARSTSLTRALLELGLQEGQRIPQDQNIDEVAVKLAKLVHEFADIDSA